jgi:hypothetical protein
MVALHRGGQPDRACEIITASDQFGGFAPESGWRRAKPPQFITQRYGLDPFRARMHGTYDLE